MIQNRIDIRDDPMLIRLFDGFHKLLFGAPIRPASALLVELAEIVQVIHVVPDRVLP